LVSLGEPNIPRFEGVLQECGKIVDGVWLWRISGR